MADPVPLSKQILCVKRELAMRQRVYTRFVSTGRMTQQKMDQEITEMSAVLESLQGLLATERPDLFRG